MVKEFMPQMEKKYRAEGTRATRGITGISMGGYGALRLAFKYPAEFAAVSAQMPALIPELPKDMSSGAPGSPGALLGDVFGSPFNRAYFDRNNVFYFARTDSAASLKRMKIYFDVGNNDDYGFEQGAQVLDKLLTVTRHSARVPHLSRRSQRAVCGAPFRRRDSVSVERYRGREVTSLSEHGRRLTISSLCRTSTSRDPAPVAADTTTASDSRCCRPAPVPRGSWRQ